MTVVLSATFGLILWLVLWSLGIKALDGFLLTIVILLTTVIALMIKPLIPGLRDD